MTKEWGQCTAWGSWPEGRFTARVGRSPTHEMSSHCSEWCVIENLGTVYFWNSPFNSFGPWLTAGNWNRAKGNCGERGCRTRDSALCLSLHHLPFPPNTKLTGSLGPSPFRCPSPGPPALGLPYAGLISFRNAL